MKWKTLESRDIFTSGIFNLRTEKLQLPDGRIMPRYFVMSFPDWVNVLPLTKDGKVILLKQYRHASGEFHIEVPGGSLDPHRNESVEQGALRELLEETGYSSSRLVKVASHYPNPALQTNQMHTFIAYDCEKTSAQNLDEFEELELYFCTLQELEDHMDRGEINHSIMLASIAQALRYLKKSEND